MGDYIVSPLQALIFIWELMMAYGLVMFQLNLKDPNNWINMMIY